MIRFFIFCLLLCSFAVSAEVFTLAPFRSNGNGSGADIFRAIDGAELWSEPVVVNGIRQKMNLRLLKSDLKECFIIFKKHFPGCVFRASPGALMIDFKLKNGTLERLYLVQMDGVYPVLQFSMSFPHGIPENVEEWPLELPISSSSRIKNTIILPERNVRFGSFSTLIPQDAAMNEITSELKAKGWTSLKQGVFVKDKPLSMMLVSFSEGKNGKTHGFVLKKPFKGD